MFIDWTSLTIIVHIVMWYPHLCNTAAAAGGILSEGRLHVEGTIYSYGKLDASSYGGYLFTHCASSLEEARAHDDVDFVVE